MASDSGSGMDDWPTPTFRSSLSSFRTSSCYFWSDRSAFESDSGHFRSDSSTSKSSSCHFQSHSSSFQSDTSHFRSSSCHFGSNTSHFQSDSSCFGSDSSSFQSDSCHFQRHWFHSGIPLTALSKRAGALVASARFGMNCWHWKNRHAKCSKLSRAPR